ncbi:hypothetical protein GW17_00018118, partial [Ensete ventricosum]
AIAGELFTDSNTTTDPPTTLRWSFELPPPLLLAPTLSIHPPRQGTPTTSSYQLLLKQANSVWLITVVFLSLRRSAMAAKKLSWCCVLLLMVLLVSSCRNDVDEGGDVDAPPLWAFCGSSDQPCDEIYVVRQGETLQTISDKCDDPYILEENPHIQDFDDVYPGLVLKITPFGGNQ